MLYGEVLIKEKSVIPQKLISLIEVTKNDSTTKSDKIQPTEIKYQIKTSIVYFLRHNFLNERTCKHFDPRGIRCVEETDFIDSSHHNSTISNAHKKSLMSHAIRQAF